MDADVSSRRKRMTTDSRSTEAVLGHRLEAMMNIPSLGIDGVSEVMSDYAADAKLFTAQGVHEGTAAIRGWTEAMVPALQAAIPNMKLEGQQVDGEVAFIVWSAGAMAPFGTDTFIITNGKIVSQTFAAYFPA
jgi:hypothetical protein